MQPNQYKDEDIIAAIKSGDAKAKNAALKQLYMDRVLTIKVKELVQIYGNSRHDPEEVIQEGIILFLQLVLKEKFQGKSAVRTFVIGICKNLIRNKTKKSSRIITKEQITDQERGEYEISPEEEVIVVEKSEAELKREQILQTLLSQLGENCSEVLSLYYYKAKSMAQIATARNLKNANQAKKAASRCRERLRKLIKAQPQLADFLKTSLE